MTTHQLNIVIDGKKHNFFEWIAIKGEKTYPDVGKRTWRVPPVKFYVQRIATKRQNKKQESDILSEFFLYRSAFFI